MLTICRANLVPVGSDQQQHIEFARNLASSFNHHCGQDIFPLPSAIISPAKRVMSLKDPTQKMSKSATDPRSRILITDSPSAISDKIRLALTDSIEGISYDPSTRPGISNLIELVSHFSPTSTSLAIESNAETAYRSCQDTASEFQNSSMRAFKEHVSSVISKALEEVRENYLELTGTKEGEHFVSTVAEAGRESARVRAEGTLERVKLAVGLL
jgi:tryptophanyl-tRNA synthetase